MFRSQSEDIGVEFVVASVIGVSRKWSGEAGEVEGVVGYHFYLVFFVVVFVDVVVVLCVRVVLGKRREYIVVCSVPVRIEDGGETASHAIASERRLNASRVFSESFCLDASGRIFLLFDSLFCACVSIVQRTLGLCESFAREWHNGASR